MEKYGLSFLCILLTLGHMSAGNLVLDVKPNTISPGLTSDLTVNCSFIYDNQPNISSIISLIISKAESQNNQTGPYTEILSINVFTKKIIQKGNTNAVASGNIDSDTVFAFLSLSWSFPSQAESGFYRCDANVVDDFGHPVDISTSVQVTVSDSDLDVLMGIVGTLQADLAVIKQKVDSQGQTIAAQNATITALKSTTAAQTSTIAAQTTTIHAQTATIAAQNLTIAELQRDLEEQLKNNTSSILELQKELDFDSSEYQAGFYTQSHKYGGHYYLYSREFVWHTDLAEYLCKRSHGYLVEIDDESEYQFFVNFINSVQYNTYVMVGATKDDQSGQWLFRHSGRPVTYFKWHSGEANSGYNCMYIHNSTREMYDMPCGMTRAYPFICEVPLI